MCAIIYNSKNSSEQENNINQTNKLLIYLSNEIYYANHRQCYKTDKYALLCTLGQRTAKIVQFNCLNIEEINRI